MNIQIFQHLQIDYDFVAADTFGVYILSQTMKCGLHLHKEPDSFMNVIGSVMYYII